MHRWLREEKRNKEGKEGGKRKKGRLRCRDRGRSMYNLTNKCLDEIVSLTATILCQIGP